MYTCALCRRCGNDFSKKSEDGEKSLTSCAQRGKYFLIESVVGIEFYYIVLPSVVPSINLSTSERNFSSMSSIS